jgi:hypothetical protein
MERKEKTTVKRFKRGGAGAITGETSSTMAKDFMDIISPEKGGSKRQTGPPAHVAVML